MDATIYALHIIPLRTSQVDITNLTLSLDLTPVSASDKVKWQLKASSLLVNIDDARIEMASDLINYMFMKPFHDAILNLLKKSLPLLKTRIEASFIKFNSNLNAVYSSLKPSYEPFMLNLLNDTNYPLNLTVTQAPLIDLKTGTLQLNFDGSFYDRGFKSNHAKRNLIYPTESNLTYHSNYIFIHESTLTSLFYALTS